MARYSKGFKARAVARLLPPESATLEQVSQELGVRADTLSRWRAEALSDLASLRLEVRVWRCSRSAQALRSVCRALRSGSQRHLCS